jgi:hypothetical protein
MFRNLKIAGVLILLVLPLLLFCPKNSDPNNGDPDVPPDSSDTTELSEKWALLVGINDYKSSMISDLSGCVNDVEMMRTLLMTKFEFPGDHIRMITNENATHEGIVDALEEHLIGNAGPNDIVVFHYSGHGSQMPDNNDDETDGFDETLVPHDSRQGGVYDISDDEINGLLKTLSAITPNVTFIFDACHSGTAVRAAGKKRGIAADRRTPPPVQANAHAVRGVSQGRNDIRAADLNYVLISGCTSKQSSFEHRADGNDYGALSYFLVDALNRSGAGATYRDIMDVVKGNVQAHYFNQSPQLEGTGLDQYVFSDSSSVAAPYFLAYPDGNDVMLHAGAAHGMTSGSVFSIYPPNTKDFSEENEVVAKVELTEVGPLKSGAAYKDGINIAQASRAVEIEHFYEDRELLLYFKDANASTVLRDIKDKVAEYGFISTVDEPHGYHLLLRQDGNNIMVEWADTTIVPPTVDINTPDAANKVARDLYQWAKWFNILSINNESSTQLIEFELKAVKSGDTRSPFAAIDSADAVIYEGEDFECTIRNVSGRSLFISMLDLSTDGSVSVIYPYPQGAGEELKPGTSVTKRFETYIPDHMETVTDVIKVYATSTPIDFHALTLPAIRGGTKGDIPLALSNDPLGELFSQAALSTSRGAKPKTVGLGSWDSAQKVYKLRRP